MTAKVRISVRIRAAGINRTRNWLPNGKGAARPVP
jgi:hypothetical protein